MVRAESLLVFPFHVPVPLTSPFTVSILPVAKFNVPRIEIPAHVRFAVVLTVAVETIITGSFAAGTTPVVQVPGVFQLPPDAVLILVVWANETFKIKNITKQNSLKLGEKVFLAVGYKNSTLKSKF